MGGCKDLIVRYMMKKSEILADAGLGISLPVMGLDDDTSDALAGEIVESMYRAVLGLINDDTDSYDDSKICPHCVRYRMEEGILDCYNCEFGAFHGICGFPGSWYHITTLGTKDNPREISLCQVIALSNRAEELLDALTPEPERRSKDIYQGILVHEGRKIVTGTVAYPVGWGEPHVAAVFDHLAVWKYGKEGMDNTQVVHVNAGASIDDPVDTASGYVRCQACAMPMHHNQFVPCHFGFTCPYCKERI